MSRLLLLFFIILCSVSIVFPQTTLYTETFSEGTLDNVWYKGFFFQGYANNMEVTSWTNNPSGDGWVGKLSTVRPDTGLTASSFSGDKNWTDFYLETNIFIPIGGGFMGIERLGIEFRVDSTGITSGYQLVAAFRPTTPTPPRIIFRKRPFENPGTPVNVKIWDDTEIPNGVPADSGWHKLAVRAEGNQFWFYFDNQELPDCPCIDTTSTSKFNSGFIGVYAYHMNFFIPLPDYSLYIDDVLVTDKPTSIKTVKESITGFSLHQNYPNPFNPTTSIKFELPISEFVQLEVFNIVGQKVRTLANNQFSAGTQQVVWDAHDDYGNEVPAGLYYYRLRAGTFEQTRKMLLVK